MEYQEFKTHLPAAHSQELQDYVTDTVMLDSRYLFFNQKRGIQTAYCTHCGKTHVPDSMLKHKQLVRATCPHCKSVCRVQAAWMGRSYMRDRAVFVWYERSLVDPQAITAQVISAHWDYSGDFRQVKKELSCSHEYLFAPRKSLYFGYQRKRLSAYSAFDRHFSGFCNYPRFMSKENIERAVTGTPFQYSTWEKYTRYKNSEYVSDMTEFFDLAARYPCIEYLTKGGFGQFIWAKLYKHNTWGAISWNAGTLPKVLRLSKAELREARALGVEITPKQLRFYQIQRKAGRKVSLSEAVILADISEGYYEGFYQSFVKLADEQTVLRYMLKQIRNGHYKTVTSMLTDWKDYRDECKQLRMNIREERYLFPNDLRKAHAETSKKIKFKRDKKLDNKIKSRLPELNKFRYENGVFLIRPAASSEELFDEGALQKICIGGYTGNYATGKTDLFFIRQKSEPEKPFYAVEISGGVIRQCRGRGNCEATPEVQAFVESFKERFLNKTSKSKTKTQGVAV
ncbi:hypothetical protein PSTEL_09565 [Paenibacillus stellifer]|uniref:PcfJ-like protein n=2 Tax=Paenibacillus stellifer TaxID=169760 RepID=A0A089LVP0_9BACL|nr:hypothetical protein PSTEL_09565 [Paenibacillus stellifer]